MWERLRYSISDIAYGFCELSNPIMPCNDFQNILQIRIVSIKNNVAKYEIIRKKMSVSIFD